MILHQSVLLQLLILLLRQLQQEVHPDLTITYWTDAGATVPYGTPASAGSGTYYIRGTDSNGCYDIKPVTVVVNPAPSVSGVQTNVLCANDLSGTIDITVSGGTAPYNYTWTGTGVIPAAEDQSGLGCRFVHSCCYRRCRMCIFIGTVYHNRTLSYDSSSCCYRHPMSGNIYWISRPYSIRWYSPFILSCGVQEIRVKI